MFLCIEEYHSMDEVWRPWEKLNGSFSYFTKEVRTV